MAEPSVAEGSAVGPPSTAGDGISAPDLARPLLPWIALGVVLGCLLDADALPPSWTPSRVWWSIGLPLSLLALALPPWRGAERLPLPRRWALFVAASCLGAWLAAQVPPPPREPQLSVLRGEVAGVYTRSFSQVLRLVGCSDEFGELGVRQLRCVAPPLPALAPGDEVRCHGRYELEVFRGRERPTLVASTVEALVPRERGAQGPGWRALRSLDAHHELAAALLMGRGDPPERDQFRRAGLLHVLAVSGLHIGLALAVAAVILRLLGLPWALRLGALAALALLYCWLTGGSVPTRRAAAMTLAMVAMALLGRRPHRLAALSLAALALVLLDPREARSIGFQLSLAAVLGICTLGVDLVRLRRRALPMQPWPLDRRAWRAVLGIGRGIGDGFAVGLAATLAVMPLTALHFGEAQPWSPVATLLATPGLMLSLGAGVVLLTLAWLAPGGPWEVVSRAVDWGLDLLVAAVDHAATWPGALAAVPPPQPWLCLLWPALFLPLRDGLDLGLRAAAAALLFGAWLLG